MKKVMKPTLKELLEYGLGAEKYLEKIEANRKSVKRVNLSKKILNIDEVGILLGLKVREILDGIKNGTIPFLRSEKRLQFDKAEVLAALNIKQMNVGRGGQKDEKERNGVLNGRRG